MSPGAAEMNISIPTRPSTFPSMFSPSMPVGAPPMEKPGSSESGLPVQTVPMMPRMRESSRPMPITCCHTCVRNEQPQRRSSVYEPWLIAVTTSAKLVIPSWEMYPWLAKALRPGQGPRLSVSLGGWKACLPVISTGFLTSTRNRLERLSSSTFWRAAFNLSGVSPSRLLGFRAGNALTRAFPEKSVRIANENFIMSVLV